MTIGERISIHRKKMNVSQEALGEKLGVSRQAVYKWESDLSLPDSSNLIELSKIFGISLNELLGETEDDKPPLKIGNMKMKYVAMVLTTFVAAILIFQQITIQRLGRSVNNLESTVSVLTQMINSNPNPPSSDQHDNSIKIVATEVNFERNTMLLEAIVELKVVPNDAEVFLLFDNERMDLVKNESGFYTGVIELKITPRVSARLAVRSADKITYSNYFGSANDLLSKHLLVVVTSNLDTHLITEGDEIRVSSHFIAINHDSASFEDPFTLGFPENNVVRDIAMVIRNKETGNEISRKVIKDEIINNTNVSTRFEKNLLNIDNTYELTLEYLLNNKILVQQLVGIIEHKEGQHIITPVETTEYNFIMR